MLNPGSPGLEPIRPTYARVPDRETWPLSFTELGLFRLITRDPDPRPYNFVFPLVVTSEVSASIIELALRFLVQRHDALRTGFSSENDGRAVRRVFREAPFSLTVSREDLGAAIRRLRSEKLDLSRPPLIAAHLVEGPERVLLIRLNHMVVDGWSALLMMQEIDAVVHALHAGEALNLPAIPLRACDVAVAHTVAYGPVLVRGQGAYPPYPADGFRLPLDRPMPERPSSTGQRVQVMLDEELEGALNRMGGGASSAVVAAYAVALARRAGRGDACFTLIQGGRNHPDLLGVVGYLVYGDSVRLDVGAATGRQLLQRAREMLRQDRSSVAPYNVLVQPPSMRVLLNMHYARVTSSLPKHFLWRPDLETEHFLFAVHDLLAQFVRMPMGTLLDLGYRPDVLDRSSVEKIAEDMLDALRTITLRPDATLHIPEAA